MTFAHDAFELVQGSDAVESFDIESIEWVSSSRIFAIGYCVHSAEYQKRSLFVDDTPGTDDSYGPNGDHYASDVACVTVTLEETETLPAPDE